MSVLYANADKTRLVPESDPEARYVVNPHDPGEFAGLIRAQQEEAQAKAQAEVDERDRQATAKAQKPAEDKAQAGPATKSRR